MLNERYSKEALYESLTLSHNADLHRIVLEQLINIPEPLPPRESAEAIELNNSIKPLRYALFAVAIEDVLNMSDPPKDMSDDSGFSPDEHQPADFNNLRFSLNSKYNARTRFYFENPNQVAADLQALVSVHHQMKPDSWDNAEMSMIGGFGTMTCASVDLLTKFTAITEEIGLPKSGVEPALRKSFRPLIEIAQVDSLQLAAILDCFEEDNFPKITYDPGKNLFRFGNSLGDLKLSPATVKHLSHYVGDLRGPQTVNQVSTGEIIIGCPVLLRPHQVKNLWGETIDLAKEMSLI